MVCSDVSSYYFQSLHLLSVSVCNIFVAWYLDWNDCSFVAIISLLVSPFRSPLDSHRNVSSWLISCLPIVIIYWPCFNLLSHFFFTDSPSFAFMCWMPSFFVSLFSFDCFNSPAKFSAALIVEFIFGRLLSWLLTIFKNWSFLYFVFKYSTVLIISALYIVSPWSRPLSPSFLFYISFGGDAFFTLLVPF